MKTASENWYSYETGLAPLFGFGIGATGSKYCQSNKKPSNHQCTSL